MNDVGAPISEPILPPEMLHANELIQCPTCANKLTCDKRVDQFLFVKCESPDYQTVITSALVVKSEPAVVRRLEQAPDRLTILKGFRNAVVGEQFIKPEFLGNEYYELGWDIGRKAITQ